LHVSWQRRINDLSSRCAAAVLNGDATNIKISDSHMTGTILQIIFPWKHIAYLSRDDAHTTCIFLRV